MSSVIKALIWFFSLCVLPFIAFTLSIMPRTKFKYDLYGKKVELDIPEEKFPTEEELQALDDALPGCEHGWFESNGYQLHYRRFMPQGKPKGVVVYQHGILAHTGNAFVLKNGRKVNGALMSDALTKAGYALYGLDMLGHGLSEGLRWFVPDWKVNRDDLDAFSHFAALENPGVPLFLFGESYGSTLVLHLARKWQDHEKTAPEGFAGIVTNAPAIVSDMPPYPVVFTLRYILAPLFPTWVPFFMPNPISADRIWRDKEVRDIHEDPRWLEISLDGGGRPFRLGTAVSLTSALEVVRESTIPGLNVPFCAIHGEKDVAVPIEGTDMLEELATTPSEDRAVFRIKEAYHDLLSDPTSEETMGYIIKYLDERVDKISASLQQ